MDKEFSNALQIPAIGGPAHGQFYDISGHHLIVSGTVTAGVEFPTTDAPPMPPEYVRHKYERQQFCAKFGSLTLSGEAWVHADIGSNAAPTVALGALIASAMK